MSQRPNVLFFFTDDQRFDSIRALGNEHIVTPNLDWLVAHGAAFTNAYIMGGTSPAVCMPSRAMLWTGRTLFHIREQGQGIAAEHVLLGDQQGLDQRDLLARILVVGRCREHREGRG